MELFKYIVKFIYRIRWWMVIFPCIAGIIAWFLTRNLEKTYDVKTTIFTGIISGYNVDATDTRNATVHMSNLMNIITTERTLKIVSLKLLARCLVYGDAERNTSYISAIHYQQLVSGIPRELQALIDKQNEEKTYHNLVAFERPSVNNFIYQLLNYTHPYFSVPLLSQHIKVARLGNSDMIEIAYSANDPGIAYNTLEILNEEFVKQYHELRYGETNNVIKFFQEELARLGKMLTAAEDSLIEYNIENRIINYGEQTKQVASMDATYRMMDNDLLVNYSTSKALIDFYEYKLGDVAKLIRTNNEFMDKLHQMSQLNTQISTMEITPDEKNRKKLEEQKNMLSNAEQNINDLALKLSAEAASTNNVSYETLISQWLDQVVLAEKTKAQMEARDIMRENLNKDFLYFSPHRRYPGPERKAYRLCGKQLYVYHGSLECSHLATKEPGNDLGFIKNHESAPVSTDLLPHQCTHDYTCIHTGDFTFHHWLFSDYRNTGPYPQRQNTCRTNHRRNSYRRIS